MARIFFDGFDHGSLKLWDSESGSLNSSSQITGAYSLTSGNVAKTIDPVSTFYVGFWAKYNSGVPSFFIGSAFLSHGSLQVRISSSGISFSYPIDLVYFHETSLGSTSVSYSTNHIQVRMSMSAGPSLLIQAKINGELVVNETITSPSYISSTATTISALSFAIRRYDYAASTGELFVDDLVIDDADWPGPSKIYTLAPNGAGNSTMWQASSGDNYTCVDDIPEDTDDYVEADTALDIDLYALESLPAGTSSVKGVQVFALAKTPGSPAYEYLQLAIRTSSVNHFSASQILYYDYRILFKFWETNPQTGIAWTVSGVNALEAGVRLVTS